MTANKENTTRVTRDEARLLKDETHYALLDAMTDVDIARAVADDPNLPPLDIDWDKANIVIPPGKDIITLRLDRDILDYIRAQGKGYQTLINKVLRTWYDAMLHQKGLAIQKATEERAAKKAAAKKPARSPRPSRKAHEKARLTTYASISIPEGVCRATRRNEIAVRNFKRPRRPRATWSSPRRVARGAIEQI